MSTEKKKTSLGKTAICFFGLLTIAAFPVLFVYFRNAGEVHFSEVIPILLIFLISGVGLFCISIIITSNPAKAGLISCAFLTVFSNYTAIERIIQSLFPGLLYWHIAPVLLVFLLHLSWIICRYIPDNITDLFMPVLSGVIALLIVLNGVIAIPSISTKLRAEKDAIKILEQEKSTDKKMPSFYFLLFDEYATIPFMQEHFQYDNSKTLQDLANLGFNISQTGYNESYWTAAVTANLFHLDYVADYDRDSSELLFKLRSDNPVFDQLRSAGYTIVSPAGAAFYGLNDALGRESKASTIMGEDVGTVLLNKTVIYPFLSDRRLDEAKTILEQLAYLQDEHNYEEYNQFMLAHIECPHTPFMFYSDGSVRDTISNSWDDLNMYLQQYQFVSDKMIEIATRIVKNNPNAIVWILSDHSARASDANGFIFSEKDMTNFFNAVYYQGQRLEIEGLSGVNTFRTLLNRLLGQTYDMIPLPEK